MPPPEIDHRHFIRAFTADEGLFTVGAERDMRRRGAGQESCSLFVFVSVDQADAGFARVRHDKPPTIGTEREEMRINAHRDRRDDTAILAIPNR